MTIIAHDSAEALAADVAERFCQLIADAQLAGRTPQVALTGGTIAQAIHARIATLAATTETRVDWSEVVFWWGDERFVAPDSADRNARQAREAFLDVLPVDPAKVHEMPSTADAASPEEGAAAYSSLLREHGAGQFDLVMLGMGPDGHVASLFPDFPQLQVEDRIAVGVTGSPKPPPERISLTFPALNRAAQVWFVVSGEEKHDAATRAQAGDPDLPASHVSGEDATVWFVA